MLAFASTVALQLQTLLFPLAAHSVQVLQVAIQELQAHNAELAGQVAHLREVCLGVTEHCMQKHASAGTMWRGIRWLPRMRWFGVNSVA